MKEKVSLTLERKLLDEVDGFVDYVFPINGLTEESKHRFEREEGRIEESSSLSGTAHIGPDQIHP